MAVFDHGVAQTGTERRSSSRDKKNRVRTNRALWKKNEHVHEGSKSGIYGNRRRSHHQQKEA